MHDWTNGAAASDAWSALSLVVLFVAAALCAGAAILPVARLRREGLTMLAIGAMAFALANVLFGVFMWNFLANLLAIALVVGAPAGIGTLALLHWAVLSLRRVVHPALLIGAALVVAILTTMWIAPIARDRAIADTIKKKPAETMPFETRDVAR
jgi:hypothetical protein